MLLLCLNRVRPRSLRPTFPAPRHPSCRRPRPHPSTTATPSRHAPTQTCPCRCPTPPSLPAWPAPRPRGAVSPWSSTTPSTTSIRSRWVGERDGVVVVGQIFLSVCTVCVCVCVCIFCIIMLEHLSVYKKNCFDNIFRLDIHYVCMLVLRFEPQGRCFTNSHCSYNLFIFIFFSPFALVGAVFLASFYIFFCLLACLILSSFFFIIICVLHLIFSSSSSSFPLPPAG